MRSSHRLLAYFADQCRWFSAWWAAAEVYAHTMSIVRGKRHGAGALGWVYAHRAAVAARWLAYGQSRGHRPPRWLRKMLEYRT